jgi:hypothetical protein
MQQDADRVDSICVQLGGSLPVDVVHTHITQLCGIAHVVSHEKKKVFAQGACIRLLIEVAKTWCAHPDVSLKMCELFYELVPSSVCAQDFVKCGGIPLLVRIIKDAAAVSELTLTVSVQIVRILSVSYTWAIIALLDQGAYIAIVGLLSRDTLPESISYDVLCILKTVFAISQEGVIAVMCAGGISGIIGVMRRSRSRHVAGYGCVALCNMMDNGGLCVHAVANAIVDLSGVELIVSLLHDRRFYTSKYFCSAACSTLAAIVVRIVRHVDTFIKCGAVDAVVRTILRHPDACDVAHQGMHVLVAIVYMGDKKYAKHVVDVGGIEAAMTIEDRRVHAACVHTRFFESQLTLYADFIAYERRRVRNRRVRHPYARVWALVKRGRASVDQGVSGWRVWEWVFGVGAASLPPELQQLVIACI